jgi:DNA-binding CsgD family transcriptional regulator
MANAMGPYDRLSLADVRDVFRLLADLREIGQGPEAWAPHLFREVDRRVGAPVANRMESAPPFAPAPAFVGLIPWGYDDRGRHVWDHYWATDGVRRDPSWLPGVARSRRTFTCPRAELVDDRAWYGSAHVQDERRAASIDHFVLTHQVLDRGDWSHTMLFYRAWGDRPFAPRDVQWIALLHDELARLWRPESRASDPSLALSPRLRQTLDGLIAGEAEKTLADRLGISLHTVHEHVKALHRRLNVRSRGELLAYWTRHAGFRRPRLTIELASPRLRQRARRA